MHNSSLVQFVPPPTQPPVAGTPTLPPQTIEEIFQGIFNSSESEQVFTTSQVNDDPYEYDYDDEVALNNNNNPTTTSQNNGWSSSTSHSSSNTGHHQVHVMGKSSKSSTSSSSKSSKSGQGLIEGKSDKDDSSLMRLEQMRYKVNGGRRGRGGGGVELLLLVVTLMTVSSYLVW